MPRHCLPPAGSIRATVRAMLTTFPRYAFDCLSSVPLLGRVTIVVIMWAVRSRRRAARSLRAHAEHLVVAVDQPHRGVAGSANLGVRPPLELLLQLVGLGRGDVAFPSQGFEVAAGHLVVSPAIRSTAASHRIVGCFFSTLRTRCSRSFGGSRSSDASISSSI